MNCRTCGHYRHHHDVWGSCRVFLCCNRSWNNYPGQRHTEHDGADHSAQPCTCNQYIKGDK